MGVQGSQDVSAYGARVLFQEDPVPGGAQFTPRDLGTIKTFDTNLDLDKIACEDGRSGTLVTVAETITKFVEEYTLTLANTSMENMAYLYNAGAPEEYAQSLATSSGPTYASPGALAWMRDGNGNRIYGLKSVNGFLAGAAAGVVTGDLEKLDAVAQEITVSGVALGIQVGSAIIVATDGVTDAANGGTYIVDSTTDVAPNTVVKLRQLAADPSLSSDEDFTGTPLIGQALYATDLISILTPDFFEVVSLDTGTVRFLSGTAFVAQTVTGVYTLAALTGKRIVNPQTRTTDLTGTFEIQYMADNEGNIKVRTGRCAITPSEQNFGDVSQFSTISISLKILSDLTSSQPAGQLLHIKGAEPAIS